jgi:hypothetical protein
MTEPKVEFTGGVEHPVIGKKLSMDTSASTQDKVESNPEYTKNASVKKLPSWGEKLFAGIKITGFGIGAVLCGAIALATFPFPVIGLGLMHAGQQTKGTPSAILNGVGFVL